MSADNWGVCPNCSRKNESEREALHEQYGKLPVHEYTRLLKEFEKREEDEPTTLREDYEIGIDEDGLFYIRYTASCHECKFRYSYKFDKDVLS